MAGYERLPGSRRRWVATLAGSAALCGAAYYAAPALPATLSSLVAERHVATVADDDDDGGATSRGSRTKITGIGKSTYFASEQGIQRFTAFLETHLPVKKLENFASDDDDDGTTCVDWMKMCMMDRSGMPCNNSHGNFQLHAVDAMMRPTGPKDLGYYEKAFDEAAASIARAKNDGADWDPLWDTSVAFYTSDLDYYARSFAAAGVKHVIFKWHLENLADDDDDADAAAYHSLLVHVNGTIINLELQSDNLTLSEEFSVAFESDMPRYFKREGMTFPPSLDDAAGEKPFVWPTKISYGTSDATRDAAFLRDVVGWNLLSKKTYDHGVEMATFETASDHTTLLQYVQRTFNSASRMQVEDFETYLNKAHTKYMVAPDYGFDRPCDFHIGLASANITDIVRRNNATAQPSRYRFFHTTDSASSGSNRYNDSFMYIAQKGGACVQLVGEITTHYDTGNYSFCAGY